MVKKYPPLVMTLSGYLEGCWKDEIAVFKGIPYAKPPVGELRWRAPQPVESWDGVRDAKKFSPTAWQLVVPLQMFLNGLIEGQGWPIWREWLVKTILKFSPRPKQSEDCLYLNVRTPQVDPNAKLPVMVWIHGGDHQDGSASDPYYDSNAFPERGIVLVTINYRLGLLGYYAHPSLSAESEEGVSGNYGTLDQIEALQWVKDNIGVFGGDPDNVTIFGESAGGESVAHMLTSPLAHGLFHRAIMQSPANSGQMTHLKQPFLDHQAMEQRGVAFAEQIGLTGASQLTRLRNMTAEALYRAARENLPLGAFYPVIDDYVLPKSPFEAFYERRHAPVPIMIGSNGDEGTLIYPSFKSPMVEYYARTPIPGQIHPSIREAFPVDTERLITLYPGLNRRDPQAEMDLLGDTFFGAKARFYAEYGAKAHPSTFFYMFKRVPPSKNQTAGAFHAAELPFVHGSSLPVLPMNKKDQELSKKMVTYWSNFAKRGNPNGNGLPTWNQFSAQNPKWMTFDVDHIGEEAIKREEKYEILNGHTVRMIEAMKALR